MNWQPLLAAVVLIACGYWIARRASGPLDGCVLLLICGVLEVAAVMWIMKGCGG